MAREIYGATLFAFAAFLSLFSFFDLINELTDLGRGGYRLQHALAFVALTLPSHVYELFPVAVLIGTLYALSHLAANSEYTVMRGSGLSASPAARPPPFLWRIFFFFLSLLSPLSLPPLC